MAMRVAMEVMVITEATGVVTMEGTTVVVIMKVIIPMEDVTIITDPNIAVHMHTLQLHLCQLHLLYPL